MTSTEIDSVQIGPMPSELEVFYSFASFDHYTAFCGDERPSDIDLYIHIFGAAAYFAYNHRVAKAMHNESRGDATFVNDVAIICKAAEDAKLNLGVHSDDISETKAAKATRKEAGLIVGCGYVAFRQFISTVIGANANQITKEATQLRPELFYDTDDHAILKRTIDAHARLAQDSTYFGNSPRSVMEKAIQLGAPFMKVQGGHEGEQGVINTQYNSSIHTTEAFRAGYPTYNHDSWATEQAWGELQKEHSDLRHDVHELAIADLVDAIGTLHVLGAKKIYVR